MIYRRVAGSSHPVFSNQPLIQPLVEALEGRRMCSAAPAGPQVVSERIIGPSSAATGIMLQFNEHLDPATASNPAAYQIGRNSSSSGGGGGGIFGPFFPFSIHPGQVLHRFAAVGTVTYDDATQTVTLNAAQPFIASTFLRFIRVRGTGAHAIRDTSGTALAGHGHTGSDMVIHLRFFRTKTFGYTDTQGDRVALKLKGIGTIAAFLPNLGNKAPLVFLDDTTVFSSTLTGAITHASKKSTGVAMLQELSGTTAAKIDLPSSLQILYSQP